MRKFLLIISTVLLFISCSNSNSDAETTKQQAKNDPANTDKAIDSSQIVYDESRDGMLVFPKGTRILGDTLGIKFYEVTLAPGDSVPLHQHPDHIFYAIDDGKGAVYINGKREEGEMKAGEGHIDGPVLDAGVNTGKTTYKFLIVDIYRPRK